MHPDDLACTGSIPKLHIFIFRTSKLQSLDWINPQTLRKVQNPPKSLGNPNLLI